MSIASYIRCPLLFSLCALALASCASRTAYYSNLNSYVSGGKYADAAGLVEKSKSSMYGEKNALLYYMDRGLLLSLNGDLRESNDAFEAAKRLSDDFFTKSITAEASTLLVSDNMRPYYGESFERVMINVFCAMNYIQAGQESEALVEARQADHYLTTLQVDTGQKNVYKEDAFVRYLMGMIYENQGQINDAFISYRKALDAYQAYMKDLGVPVPQALVNDALRTARQLGFRDDISEISGTWGASAAPAPAAGEGELVVLNYNGLAPEKIDQFIEVDFGKGWGYVHTMQTRGDEAQQVEQAGAIARSIAFDEQVRVAFPKYVPVPYRISSMETIVDGKSALGETVENVGGIAERSLSDRIARVRIRAIARAVVKYALAQNVSRQVGASNGDAAAWLTKKILTVASSATELSDKRCWRSLPDKIVMARLALPAGKHAVKLRFLDANGAAISERSLENIEIRPGKKTFTVVRTAQ